MLSVTEAQKLKRTKSVFNFFFLFLHVLLNYNYLKNDFYLPIRDVLRICDIERSRVDIVIFDCILINIIINVTNYRKSDDMLS